MASLTPWRITMLGGLSAWRNNREVVRFRTRKTGGLLGYLSYNLNQNHHRDELVDIVWPDLDVDRGRVCLSSAVYSLRRQLEPPDVPAGSVLITNRFDVRLNPQTVTTDLQEFAFNIERAAAITEARDRLTLLESAINLYRGELLPGCQEDWVGEARDRISLQYLKSARSAIQILEELGDPERALEIAMQASACVPDREDAHYEAIRLLRLVGKDHDAARQYRNLEMVLEKRWERKPSKRVKTLVKGLDNSGEKTARAKRVSVPRLESPQDLPGESKAARLNGPVAPAIPITATKFFGREREIAQLLEWILPIRGAGSKTRHRRLITLVGPAGSGKTRLALEVAHAVRERVLDTVAFTTLVDVSDSDGICDAILSSLGRKAAPKDDYLDQVCECLAEYGALLVLDNLEHLDGCGGIIREILSRLPNLSVLATSRCPTGLAEEQVLPVWPLPFPSQELSPCELLDYASVQMFLDRAQSVSPTFQITSRNAKDVGELCVRLEGLPLAIELAAPRLFALTLSQILGELGNRFEFLVSKNRCVDPRHGALHSAIEWSYNRLDEDTRRFFRGLSVFKGGWTLEAARAVCGSAGALDHLEELVRQSLVIAEDAGNHKRFRMFESLREFLHDQMEESELAVFERMHTAYFHSFLESRFANFRSPARQNAILEVAEEKENFRAVLAREINNAVGLAVAGMLWPYWSGQGHALEGKDWLLRALGANPSADAKLHRQAEHGLSSVYFHLGELALAQSAAESCLEASRNANDRCEAAQALNLLGFIMESRGEYEAAYQLLKVSLEHWRAENDRWAEAGVLNNLGLVAHRLGDLDGACSYYNLSQAIFRELGDRLIATHVLNNLALVATERKDYQSAVDALEKGMAVANEIGDSQIVPIIFTNLGEARFRMGDFTRAENDFKQSIRLRREAGDHLGQDYPLSGLGVCLCMNGDLSRGVRLISAALEIRKKRCGTDRLYPDPTLEKDLSYIRKLLDSRDFEEFWTDGKKFSIEESVQNALEEFATNAIIEHEIGLLSNLSEDISSECCKIGV